MDITAFARRSLLSDSLEAKLSPVRTLFTDNERGPAERHERPGRPENLLFAPRRTAPAMPSPTVFDQPGKRGIAHHIMANHELQALEVMAAVLLAFPEAPPEYRRGMAAIMQDEQRHTRMHMERAASLGVPFGSLPVNSHIWQKGMQFTTVLEYLAGLPLTFEGCNLDHTLELEAAFLAVDDPRSAAVMRQIHRDEIEHVAFGITWLRRFKPANLTDWDVYRQSLHWPMRPEKSLGHLFDRASREAAGLDEQFIDELARLAETEQE